MNNAAGAHIYESCTIVNCPACEAYERLHPEARQAEAGRPLDPPAPEPRCTCNAGIGMCIVHGPAFIDVEPKDYVITKNCAHSASFSCGTYCTSHRAVPSAEAGETRQCPHCDAGIPRGSETTTGHFRDGKFVGCCRFLVSDADYQRLYAKSDEVCQCGVSLSQHTHNEGHNFTPYHESADPSPVSEGAGQLHDCEQSKCAVKWMAPKGHSLECGFVANGECTCNWNYHLAASPSSSVTAEQIAEHLASEIWDNWHGPLAKIPANHRQAVKELIEMLSRLPADLRAQVQGRNYYLDYQKAVADLSDAKRERDEARKLLEQVKGDKAQEKSMLLIELQSEQIERKKAESRLRDLEEGLRRIENECNTNGNVYNIKVEAERLLKGGKEA